MRAAIAVVAFVLLCGLLYALPPLQITQVRYEEIVGGAIIDTDYYREFPFQTNSQILSETVYEPTGIVARVKITFLTQTGIVYRVQASPSLQPVWPEEWKRVSPSIVGTGTNIMFQQGMPPPAAGYTNCFYRIMTE